MFDDDRAFFAFGAFDVEGDRLGVFAFGVARARQEPPIAPIFDDHRAMAFWAFAAIFDDFFFGDDLSIGLSLEIFRIFARRVIRARQEVPIFTPFDDHRIAAFFACNIGLLGFCFDIAHL